MEAKENPIVNKRHSFKPGPDIKRHRFPKGKDWNGNRLGPPRQPEIQLLREALEKAKQKKGKDFLQHFVERAYENDAVAIALAKKLIPDQLEGKGFENKTFILRWKEETSDNKLEKLEVTPS